MIHKSASYGLAALTAVTFSLLGGCSRPQPMAPPVAAQPPVVTQAPPVNASMGAPSAPQGENVYPWQDVPVGQKVPITRGVFDQGGYQLFAASGETIVVPFANQNMYVMKFGIEDNGMYFLNDGKAPTLYLPRSGWLENAAAQGAKWYPFSKDFAYSRPVYMGIAPSWSAYTGMGWYPGMVYHGGYWGYNPWHPGIAFVATPGLFINIGGRPYYGWNSYSTYYRSNPGGRIGWGRSYNYASVSRGRSGSFGSTGRSFGSTGSFGRSSGRPGGSSFGRTATGSSGSFGRTSGSAGSSFGRTTGSNNFGTSRNTTGTGSFGRSTSGTGSSFGSTSGTRSSFGSGSSGFGSTSGTRSSFGSGSTGSTSSFGRSGSTSSFGSGSTGSSFGRSSGSSFGGGSSFGRSSGGSSFGRSSGSSFGGGRSGGRRR
jgi:hypothetical protein